MRRRTRRRPAVAAVERRARSRRGRCAFTGRGWVTTVAGDVIYRDQVVTRPGTEYFAWVTWRGTGPTWTGRRRCLVTSVKIVGTESLSDDNSVTGPADDEVLDHARRDVLSAYILGEPVRTVRPRVVVVDEANQPGKPRRTRIEPSGTP